MCVCVYVVYAMGPSGLLLVRSSGRPRALQVHAMIAETELHHCNWDVGASMSDRGVCTYRWFSYILYLGIQRHPHKLHIVAFLSR